MPADQALMAASSACRDWDVLETVNQCVLPLAGDKAGYLFPCRQAGPVELGNLAVALGIDVNIVNVFASEFATTEGAGNAKLSIDLLCHGGHFDVLFR